MIRAVLLCGLVAGLSAQDHDRLFSVALRDGTELVTANRAAVACDVAIDELASSLDWVVTYPPGDLQERLAREVIDLCVTDRDPRLVASLIASISGADAIVLDHGGARRTEIVIVGVPDGTTEAGRQRLRDWALDRYRECLAEHMRSGDDGETQSLRVRMHMAELLTAKGALRDAATLLEQVYALAPEHEYVPQALLRMARCWFELGPETWIEAERRARDLARTFPARPEGAAATVLLGRILLAQGRAAECVATLERSYLVLSDAPEIVDVYLLVAMARYRLGDPESVARTMATLDFGRDLARLDPSQRAEHEFLTGYAALERGMPRRAARAFEQWFTLAAESDPLRGPALVMLGEAYFQDHRYLQARAAAIHARRLADGLDRTSARRSAELYASTALALADDERSLQELEVEVRRDPSGDGELTLFLAELFRARARYSRCIDVLTPLVELSDPIGDRARLLTLGALHDQARDSGGWQAFVDRGRPLAVALLDPASQQRAAELLGRAYEELGDVERAADAYRGILR